MRGSGPFCKGLPRNNDDPEKKGMNLLKREQKEQHYREVVLFENSTCKPSYLARGESVREYSEDSMLYKWKEKAEGKEVASSKHTPRIKP